MCSVFSSLLVRPILPPMCWYSSPWLLFGCFFGVHCCLVVCHVFFVDAHDYHDYKCTRPNNWIVIAAHLGRYTCRLPDVCMYAFTHVHAQLSACPCVGVSA